jgi:hypothetical protein
LLIGFPLELLAVQLERRLADARYLAFLAELYRLALADEDDS